MINVKPKCDGANIKILKYRVTLLIIKILISHNFDIKFLTFTISKTNNFYILLLLRQQDEKTVKLEVK